MRKETAIKYQVKRTTPLSGVIRSLPIHPDRWGNVQLVEGLVEGDPAAAEVLFDRYGTLINRRVWHLLGTDSDHDDLVQQVFVQLLDSIHALRNPDALGPWINRVLINTVSKEIRYRTRRKWLTFVPEIPERASESSQERDMAGRQVHLVLGTMKATDRMVFVMRFVEDAKMEEIASSFGWSPAKTRRKVARAREVFVKKAMRNPMLAFMAEEYKK
jgi:RNA polymerase sigma-70 factor (ECF subfamily)